MERQMTKLNRRMELKSKTKQVLYSSQLDSSRLTLDTSIRHASLQSGPLGLLLQWCKTGSSVRFLHPDRTKCLLQCKIHHALNSPGVHPLGEPTTPGNVTH